MRPPPGVTVLEDGGFDFDPRLLSCVREAPDAAAHRLGCVVVPDAVRIPVLAFLLDLRSGPTLVDAGAGSLLGPGMGGVAAALAAAGIAPGEIAHVALTHLHGDHCGGLLAPDGSPAFANARILLPKGEAEAWLEAEPPEELRPIAADAARALAPYAARAERIAPGWRGLGLELVAAPGHTPGHGAWAVPELGVLACGDIWHLPALQMDEPECGSDWDMDARAAARTRRDLTARAKGMRWTLLGAHAGAVTTRTTT